MTVVVAYVMTIGVAFSQGTLNPGTATDLQRLDVIGPSRIGQLMKSAAAGNAESQLRLGLACQTGFDSVSGEEIGRNSGLAAKWFRAAADQENVNAQYKLGIVLVNGDGGVEITKRLLHGFVRPPTEIMRSMTTFFLK